MTERLFVKKRKEKKKKELKYFGQQRNNIAFARDTAAVALSLQFLQCCPILACRQNGATVLVFTDNFNFVVVDNGLPRTVFLPPKINNFSLVLVTFRSK